MSPRTENDKIIFFRTSSNQGCGVYKKDYIYLVRGGQDKIYLQTRHIVF